MAKHIDQLPVAHVPENYPYVLPTSMAQAAMEYGPIFRIDWPSMSEAVCLVGPEANTLLYHTHETHFSHDIGWGQLNQMIVGKGLIALDGPEHMHYRRMINPIMTAHHGASHFDLLCEIVQQRIDTWEDQGIIDLRDEIRTITFTVAARLLYHIDDKAEVLRLCDAFHHLLLSGSDPAVESREQFLQRFDARDEINQIFNQTIKKRRHGEIKYAEEDLIDILMRSVNMSKHPLNEREFLAHIRTMFTAGYETGTVLGCSLLYLLSTHPAYLERVYAEFDAFPEKVGPPLVLERLKEMKLLGYALQEAGRLYGPAGNIRRGVIKAFEFGGYRVPEGAFVLLSAAGGHWLPTVFSRPEQFDPDRFAPPREEHKNRPHSLIHFGSGQRTCSGIHLAQIELKAIATLILRKWQLEQTDQHGITIAYFNPDGFLAHGLKMRVKRRKSRLH